MTDAGNFDPVTPGGVASKLGAVAVGTAVELMTQAPGVGAVAAVGAEAFMNIVGSHVEARQQRALEALAVGSGATGASVDDLWAAIANDRQRLELVGRALVAAGRATTTEKVTVLGQALFTGALAKDPATVDSEGIFIDAMATLDAPHVKALAILTTQSPGHQYARVSATSSAASAWSPEQLAVAYPGIGTSVTTILATLASAGAIVDVAVGTLDYWPTWTATDFGRNILDRLAAATEAVDAEDASPQ